MGRPCTLERCRTIHASLLLCALATAGCQSSGERPQLIYSSAYRAATFEDAGRLSRIQGKFPSIRRIFHEYAKDRNYVGQAFGVVVDGELVLSETLGVSNLETRRPVDSGTKFHIASLTKSFTSMAVLRLRDAGKLNLQDPVSLYLPEVSGVEYLTSDAAAFSVEQLMTMTSGLPEDNPWADRHLEDSDAQLMSLLSGGVSFSSNPGSAYEYSNLGYAMLGALITRVSGRAYERYITEEILEPLGMHETYWDYTHVPPGELAQGYRWEDEQWKVEPMLRGGAFGSIGGLITSLDDFAKYVALPPLGLAAAQRPRRRPPAPQLGAGDAHAFTRAARRVRQGRAGRALPVHNWLWLRTRDTYRL